MKRKGRHPEKALTSVRIRSLTPGRYADGNGLYLVVDDSGAKRWILRTVVRGHRSDLGLGSVSLVSLAEAREQATRYRKIARAGGDPIGERRKAKTITPTFAEAAYAVHAEHQRAWKNRKHAAQWISTLRQYVFPTIGDLRINQIETADVLRVLAPIWLTKPETARRIKQRLRTVLDWANAAGLRSGVNPVDGVSKGLPRQSRVQQHYAALSYAETPSFIQELRASVISDSVKLAFELLILTATRTSEVLKAKCSEIDLENGIWTIPVTRMKAGREHRIPLSPRCFDILVRAQELAAGSDYVFPGRSGKAPMSNMVFLMVLRRMGLQVTTHGFRSAFRDWAAERTNWPREVCEAALAHTIKDRAEAAYRRGDLLERRRELMCAWAAFATTQPAKVITLRVG